NTRSEWSAPHSSLRPNHLELIMASAISPEVSRERGYRSETVKAHARKLGFSPLQCCTPCLIIPLYSVRGECAGYQLRPDLPRIKDGKSIKYETPRGMRMVLDCHPRSRTLFPDPSKPLLITEGVRKADAVVSIGLCAIALLGVWNWRGSNEKGGKAALPDWEYIPLNGRTVSIAFDSDVMMNRKVHTAVVRLKAFLKSRAATVLLIYLTAGPHGEKVGLDDWIAMRKRENLTDADIREALLGLSTTELRQIPGEDLDASNRPAIFVDGSQLREKVRDALAALAQANDPPVLFCRAGMSTRLRDHGGSPELETLDDSALLSELSEAANWYRHSRSGEAIDVDPPANVIRAVRGSRSLPFPTIDAIVRAPFFTPDGTL